MRRAVHVALVLLLAWSLVSCGGGTFFFSTGDNGTTFLTTSGTVSIVHLTVIDGDVLVTVVTLISGGFGTTNNFCGDVVSQFPMQTFVTVHFTPGNPCNTVVQVFF
ncbi:MAG: hypothetical protein ACE14M_00780 [Terriglobales bacterium]